MQTNTRQGAHRRIGKVFNFVCISVKPHRYKISKQITQEQWFLDTFFTHWVYAQWHLNCVVVTLTSRSKSWLNFVFGTHFENLLPFDYCVITLSGYFATQNRLLCVATSLVKLQNVEKLEVCKLTQGEGHISSNWYSKQFWVYFSETS